MVEYFGIFVDNQDIEKIIKNEKNTLEKQPNNFHCTFAYKPKNIEMFNDIIGKNIDILLIGYGCDGKNSGFKVSFPNDMKKYFLNADKEGNLKVPHITTSLSKTGKAINTANLKFEDIEESVVIKGKFGAFVVENNKRYISFEKIHIDQFEKQ